MNQRNLSIEKVDNLGDLKNFTFCHKLVKRTRENNGKYKDHRSIERGSSNLKKETKCEKVHGLGVWISLSRMQTLKSHGGSTPFWSNKVLFVSCFQKVQVGCQSALDIWIEEGTNETKDALIFFLLLLPMVNQSKHKVNKNPRHLLYCAVAHFMNLYAIIKSK